MNKPLEKTLLQALEQVQLPKLPDAWDKETIYLKAVVKVLKTDGTEAYCLSSKNKENEDNITHMYGSVCSIARITEVYPYSFLQAKYMPETKGKPEKIEYLRKYYHLQTGEQFEGMKTKELDEEIVKTAIKQQLGL